MTIGRDEKALPWNLVFMGLVILTTGINIARPLPLGFFIAIQGMLLSGQWIVVFMQMGILPRPTRRRTSR